jgi:hypothetical protein
MPKASAKYISPLDNPTWHVFREVLRKQNPLTTINLPSHTFTNFLFIIQNNKSAMHIVNVL